MYRALLAADGQVDRVMKQAEAIAALPHAAEAVSVLVLNVYEDTSTDVSSEMLAPDRVNAVSEAVDYLEAEGISVEAQRVAGDPAQTIIGVADEIDADGVFIGGAKRSPAGKALFGSVTQQVILNGSRPTTVTID